MHLYTSPHPDFAGQKETTYNYDFIDDFKWVKEGQNSEASEDNDGSICTKIKQMLMSKCQNPSNHVLNLMVCLL